MTRHVSDVQLRWADLDPLGHVNNVVYLRYLQEARVDMLFVDAAARGTQELADGVVVARHEIAYRTPLAYRPAPVRVETWVREVRAASFRLGYEVVDVDPATGDRTVHAIASSTLVPYDLAAGRPRRLRGEEPAVLEKYLEADGPKPGVGQARPAATEAVEDTRTAPLRHRYPCTVRWDDLDSYGHVNNVTFLEYLQEARVDFAQRHLVGVGDLLRGAVVAGHAIDYLAPVSFRAEPIDVDAWVARVGRSSFDVGYEVRAGDEVCARGVSTLVAWDMGAGRTRALARDERSALTTVAGAGG